VGYYNLVLVYQLAPDVPDLPLGFLCQPYELLGLGANQSGVACCWDETREVVERCHGSVHGANLYIQLSEGVFQFIPLKELG
jgi:hypothetical protein